MLSCAGADRLQTGMRGAFGKAHGTAARVRIGQIPRQVQGRMHRGSQALQVQVLWTPEDLCQQEWGFTKWDRDEYNEMREDGRLKLDGVNVKYMPSHGPLSVWCKTQAELAGL